jgi:hypothetical protein
VRSDSAAAHLVNLKPVLERTGGHGLNLTLAKCLFGKWSVELLGRCVSHGLVRQSDGHTVECGRIKRF